MLDGVIFFPIPPPWPPPLRFLMAPAWDCASELSSLSLVSDTGKPTPGWLVKQCASTPGTHHIAVNWAQNGTNVSFKQTLTKSSK